MPQQRMHTDDTPHHLDAERRIARTAQGGQGERARRIEADRDRHLEDQYLDRRVLGEGEEIGVRLVAGVKANGRFRKPERVHQKPPRRLLRHLAIWHLHQHQRRQADAALGQLRLDRSMRQRALAQGQPLEVDQLLLVTVASKEAHHANAGLQQALRHRIDARHRRPVLRSAQPIAGVALEARHISVARRCRHHHGVVGFQHIAEQRLRLLGFVEAVMRFIHDHADAQALLAREHQQIVDG